MKINALSRCHAAVLIAVAAVGLFAAGFGYGYETQPFEMGFDDPGFRPGPHGPIPANF